MNVITSNINFDFGELNDFYYNLLIEEDFDFKTKDISIVIQKNQFLKIEIKCNSILDFKIANSALIKSLEVIQKTINI